MIESEISFQKYLESLKKEELNNIIKKYNSLCNIYEFEASSVKKNKKDLVKEILNVLDNYIKGILMCLDLEDYQALLRILKVNDNELLNNNKDLINYLLDLKIIEQKDNLQIFKEIKTLIKRYLNDKEVINCIKKNDAIYKVSKGIIIAYGVVDIEHFKVLTGTANITSLLDFYYKKDYIITDKMIYSEKLTNKKRIDRYYKDTNYKEFKTKDFLSLGTSLYHHSVKAYKKFIKMLKNNYVFKKSDLEYVDINVVIPYLYNSLNEEELAKANLEEIVISLFEFKGEKLKHKMMEEIMAIRKDFPLWEYRGYTKNEKEKV